MPLSIIILYLSGVGALAGLALLPTITLHVMVGLTAVLFFTTAALSILYSENNHLNKFGKTPTEEPKADLWS